MLIRFWCDSDITFSRGLHKNLVTVLYFSIIIVLCGVGGDTSFAPQANLVLGVYPPILRAPSTIAPHFTCIWVSDFVSVAVNHEFQ